MDKKYWELVGMGFGISRPLVELVGTGWLCVELVGETWLCFAEILEICRRDNTGSL